MNKALIGTIGLSLALLTACGGDTSEAPTPDTGADSSISTPNATPEDGDATATPEDGDVAATPEEEDPNAADPNATPPEEDGEADDDNAVESESDGEAGTMDLVLAERFADAITASRDQEQNDAFEIMSTPDHPMAEFIFPMIGMSSNQLEAFAVSVSAMNTHAYGIAVVLPAEGQEDVILAGLQGFIDLQISNFNEYLEDQKIIAENARLETLENGTIVMVMGEGQDETFDAIVAALA